MLNSCIVIHRVVADKDMDVDGFESHISSSDSDSIGNGDGEADDEQSDWVGYAVGETDPFVRSLSVLCNVYAVLLFSMVNHFYRIHPIGVLDVLIRKCICPNFKSVWRGLR